MATLQDISVRCNDSGLRNRVHAACLLEVPAIVIEDVATPNHAERLAWAKRILAGGNTAKDAAQQMMTALIAVSPDAIYADDADVTAAVSAIVTYVALMG